MLLELYPQDALIDAAQNAPLPVAFLVGAPLSIDVAGGVPGVAAMVNLVRDAVQSKIPSQVANLNAALSGKSGGDAYQTAISWLKGHLTQDAVNRVVRKAVLQARKTESPTTFDRDGSPPDWYLPAGIKQLAALVVRQPELFPGPVLTTNFDPLISLAIRDAGGTAIRRVVHSDGSLARDVEVEPGITQVVHLHGYWRDSDTLHTRSQLTSDRLKLQASLRRVLQQRTFMVLAYGGWEDVFAGALADLLNDESAQINVFWCFHENDPALVEARYKQLIERVTPAITRGRFLAYGGIDCHSICAAIGGTSVGIVPSHTLSTSPLVGWELIDPGYLSSLPPLTTDEAVRYFDGAVPTWRHALSDLIPRRQLVPEVTGRLNGVRSSKGDGTFQLIRAAGGEGKSTLLLQIAANLARSGDWIVLSRPLPQIGLVANQVVKLEPARQWLIVADDAENLVHQLRDSASALHNAGRSNVHFLLAARDADWRAKGGDRQNFDSLLQVEEPVILRGISLGDAKAVVTAWSKCGPAALKALSNLPDSDRQAAELFNATKVAGKEKREGSLFGGLLAVRFDEAGLRAHVREFLSRLREIKIAGSDSSLFDALVYVAAVHAVDIPGLDENVLADFLSVPRHWVNTRVIRPLGEETTAVQSAGHVFTRHRKIAEAILVEAEVAFGVDLAEVWAAIVRQTVKTGQSLRMDRRWYSRIIHSAPHVYRGLPGSFSKERRKEIAVAAAEADIEVEPNHLAPIINLGRTYRLSGDTDQAIAVFRDNLSDVSSKIDFQTYIRGYWYEWGVCEGESGADREHALANAWLCGIALSDELDPAVITEANVKWVLSGAGLAFGRLARLRADGMFGRSLRSVAYLLSSINPDRIDMKFSKQHDKDADELEIPQVGDAEESVTRLSTGFVEAGRQVQDVFLRRVANPKNLSFNSLHDFLFFKMA